MSFRNEKKFRLSYGASYDLKSNLISLGMKKMYPDRKINSEYLRRQSLQAYASILGNIGVSLASISVLKD